MANRTFKVYGQAYAASGDVTATLTINGTQVFNGAVNDSTTVRSGPPSESNHLFSFELDENTTGDLSFSLTSANGELCLGQLQHNGILGKPVLDSWVTANIPEGEVADASEQQHIATTIGQAKLDAVSPGLYDKLMAGTATRDDAILIGEANVDGPREFDTFVWAIDNRTNLQMDGSEMTDVTDRLGHIPIINDGSTFSCTWTFDPDSSYTE